MMHVSGGATTSGGSWWDGWQRSAARRGEEWKSRCGNHEVRAPEAISAEEESPVLSANTKAYVEDSFVEGQPRSFTGRSRKRAKTFDLTGEPAAKRASGTALFASPQPTKRCFEYLDSAGLESGASGDED